MVAYVDTIGDADVPLLVQRAQDGSIEAFDLLVKRYEGRVAVLACLAFDFFLLDPVFSLSLKDVQDAIDLCVFLVVALLVCWIFAQHKKLVKQTNQLKELESIRFEQRLQEQRTEVNRLRKKIEIPAGCHFIHNEPNVGYRFQLSE